MRSVPLVELTSLLLLVACGGGGGGGTGTDVGGSGPPPTPTEPSCVALDVTGPAVGSPVLPPTSGCARTSVGLVPLPDLGTGTYQGFEGGLYCGGSNARPTAHEAAGLSLAQAVVPRGVGGAPDAAGKYVFVSIGMSNTTQEFSAFQALVAGDAARDPHLVIVDGAQGGQTGAVWADASAAAWTTVDQRLAAAGVSGPQVAVAWVKLAEATPTQAFPGDVAVLASDLAATLRNLRARYPNCRLAYLSSRIYAGYATTSLNPEPYAYQSAFAVKKVVVDQLTGDPTLAFDDAGSAPWLAWGPYLWADGTTASGAGLTWACADFGSDGTHPSTAGRAKVASLLDTFVRTDTTARAWYLAAP